MDLKLQQFYDEYHRLIDSIPFKEEDLDYSVLEKHIPHLDKIDHLERSAVSVYDLFQKTHVYTSPLYRNKLGISEVRNNVPEGFEMLMPTEDHLMVLKAGIYFLGMGINIEPSETHKYKAINDFRIRKQDCRANVKLNNEENWMRITEEHRILESDPNGNIWLVLSTASVSSNQDTDSPVRSMVIHHETGELIVFPEGEKTPFINLTLREIEVLKLISKGYYSKEISDYLDISIHTVNTHRQNIIEKMKVSNTTEAVQLAMKFGYLK